MVETLWYLNPSPNAAISNYNSCAFSRSHKDCYFGHIGPSFSSQFLRGSWCYNMTLKVLRTDLYFWSFDRFIVILSFDLILPVGSSVPLRYKLLKPESSRLEYHRAPVWKRAQAPFEWASVSRSLLVNYKFALKWTHRSFKFSILNLAWALFMTNAAEKGRGEGENLSQIISQQTITLVWCTLFHFPTH